MSKQVKWRRGTTVEHSTFIGAVGEVTVDTTKQTVVVHDGVTLGGHSGELVEKPASTVTKSGGGSVQDFIDNQPTKLATKLGAEHNFSGANPDLVSKIKALGDFRGMYMKVESATVFVVGFGMGIDDSNGSWGVEYRFAVNGDNLILLRGIYSGLQDTARILAEPTLSGTFNTNTARQAYTTQVGDKFTSTFTGSRMYFKAWNDTRGGMWKVTLSDGQTRNVSTYSATGRYVERLIFDNMLHDEYAVEFEFLGDDPFNVPSGGVGTARGWLFYTPSVPLEQPIRFAAVGPLITATRKAVMTLSSIPDFAISARPNGAAYGAEWVPQHSTVTGVSTGVLLAIMIDGVRASAVAGSIPSGVGYGFREISQIKILQRFKAENPNGTDGAMWMHYVSHSISKESKELKIENRLEVLQSTAVGLGYLAMFPANANNVSRLLLNDGTETEPVPKDASDFTHGWGVTSAMYSGEHMEGRGHGIAINVSSLREASSLMTPLQPTYPMRITHRADGVSKVYWTWAENAVLTAGQVYTCATTYSAVSGVRTPVADLRTI